MRRPIIFRRRQNFEPSTPNRIASDRSSFRKEEPRSVLGRLQCRPLPPKTLHTMRSLPKTVHSESNGRRPMGTSPSCRKKRLSVTRPPAEVAELLWKSPRSDFDRSQMARSRSAGERSTQSDNGYFPWDEAVFGRRAGL